MWTSIVGAGKDQKRITLKRTAGLREKQRNNQAQDGSRGYHTKNTEHAISSQQKVKQ